MYRVEEIKKRDPELRWAMPDRVFFACGACHILAYAFTERHGTRVGRTLWLKPAAGFIGNHIFVAGAAVPGADVPGANLAGGDWVFDYHGYSARGAFLAHTARKARRWWPGWNATLIELPREALVSESMSRTYEGLWLREPRQFLHDALPRAHAYLGRFPPP